jgi:YVTN family beta-propeller protein
VKVSPAGEILKIIGSKGSDRGLFENPVGVAQGPGGNLYVADNGNSRVQVFDAAGKVLRVIKLKTRPLDVAVDSSGRLFVCTDDGNKVSVFSADGGSLGYLVDEKGSPEPLKGIRGLTVTPDGDLVGVGGDTVKEFRLLASSK